jgi:hypothetical protein
MKSHLMTQVIWKIKTMPMAMYPAHIHYKFLLWAVSEQLKTYWWFY